MIAAKYGVLIFVCSLVSGCASMGAAVPGNESKSDASSSQLANKFARSGDQLFADGQYQDALVQYMLALEQDNENADTFYKVGSIHRLQNNLDLAENSFRQAMRLSPGHIPSREGLGLVALRKENYTYAKLMLEGVLNADENRFEAMNALGVLHDLQEEYDLAQQYYLKALESFPRSAKLLNNLGYSYYLQQNWSEAEKYFKEAVSYRPGFSQGWSNLALAYLQQNRYDSAQLAFEKTVDSHQALNNIGYFEFLRNNDTVARQKFDEAVKSSPSYYAVAQQNLASLSTADGDNNSNLVLTNTRASADTGDAGDEQEATTSSTITFEPVDPTRSTSIGQASTEADDAAPVSSTGVLTAEQIEFIQEKLTELGYDPGPVDGVIGNQTISAVRQFQRDEGGVINGIIDSNLLRLL